jgi:hypothetical protein
MNDITLKRMHAATDKIVGKVFESCLDPENSIDYDKALRIAAEGGFLAGMEAAAKLKHQVRTEETPSDYEYGEGWDAGHDAHQSAIRATVGRLKKEAKSNG